MIVIVRKVEKMSFVNGPLRKPRFYKWAFPKMQQIIKQAGSSTQLFETANFAFINILMF